MDTEIQKTSKVEILRVLVIDKMTAAMREIRAVVEKTVAGYKTEVLSLKRELSHSRTRQDTALQPQGDLHRTDINAIGATDITISTDARADEWRLKHKSIKDCGASDKCTQGTDNDVFHEETLLEHEASDCSLADLPSDCFVSCPENRVKKDCVADAVNDVQKVKRRGRLLGRHRSNREVADHDSENEWKPKQNKKLRLSNVKIKHLIKLKISLLKNSSDTALSNNDPVQTIMCQQNVSESDFINLLRSTFPQLGENKPFDSYLADGNKTSVSHLPNRMTAAELYTALQHHKQKQFEFYIQLKEHEDAFDTLTNTLLLNHEKTMTGDLEEAPSETGSTRTSIDEKDGTSSVDSSAQSDDNDSDWDNEDKEHSPKPKTKRRKKRQRQKLSCDPCKVCGQLFNSETILTKHALSHLDDPECVCAVCGQQLESSEELKTHVETHQKLHQCDTCGRYFLNFYTCKKHVAEKKCIKEFTTDKLHQLDHDKFYKCDICPQFFKYQAQLNVHYRKHTGEQPFCCDICGKSLVNFRSLCRHKLTHTGQKKYSCKTCGSLFTTDQGLKAHEKTHSTREKTFLCDICSKSFYTNGMLSSHRKRHDESFNVKCPICDKSLKGDLMVHMKVHMAEKPFSCSECGRNFKTRKHLAQHMRSHLGIKPFTCTVCGYTCGRKGHLDAHMRIHTGQKPYKCSLCDKAFTQSHCLKTHMKSHPSAGAEPEGRAARASGVNSLMDSPHTTAREGLGECWGSFCQN